MVWIMEWRYDRGLTCLKAFRKLLKFWMWLSMWLNILREEFIDVQIQTLGIRANENPRKDNCFVTAKDQSECQLISGTKLNKKRPGRWSWVVDLCKTDWQDTKKVLKAHWQSYKYLCVNNLECMWHVLRSVSRPAVLYSHCAQFPRWIIEREQSDSLRDSVWNSDSLWLQITPHSVSQIRLIYIISHLNDLCQTDFRWLHRQEKFLKVNAWVWEITFVESSLTAYTIWTRCSQHIFTFELNGYTIIY